MIASVSLAIVAALFGFAASRKLAVSSSFHAAVAAWPVVPQRWKRAVAAAIPVSECAVALVALLALAGNPGMIPLGLGLAIALLGAFVAVQTVMAAQKVEADCGCVSQGRQIGASSILRAALLGVIPAVGLLSLVRW